MIIYRTCPMCGQETALEIPDDLAYFVWRYQEGYGYIQDIPLPPNQREFIKTGLCMECQELLFALPEDEEEEEI